MRQAQPTSSQMSIQISGRSMVLDTKDRAMHRLG